MIIIYIGQINQIYPYRLHYAKDSHRFKQISYWLLYTSQICHEEIPFSIFEFPPSLKRSVDLAKLFQTSIFKSQKIISRGALCLGVEESLRQLLNLYKEEYLHKGSNQLVPVTLLIPQPSFIQTCLHPWAIPRSNKWTKQEATAICSTNEKEKTYGAQSCMVDGEIAWS